MKATEDGNVEAVKCLIKHGAQVDLKNENRKSALEFGCVNGNVEVVKILLEVEGVKGLSSGDIQHFVSSAFSAAVNHNHTKLVKWFLESGTVTDIPYDTLFMAIYHQNSELTQLLLDHGAQLNRKDDLGIMLAASEGNVEVVKELLERGADVNLKGKGGSTALLSVLSVDNHMLYPNRAKLPLSSYSWSVVLMLMCKMMNNIPL